MIGGLSRLLLVVLFLWNNCASAAVVKNLRESLTRYPATDYSLDALGADSAAPSLEPTAEPSAEPSAEPTASLTDEPTLTPSTFRPSTNPTINPSIQPTVKGPTKAPTRMPTCKPTKIPSREPTALPTPLPGEPTLAPTVVPTISPSHVPTAVPSTAPTEQTSPIVKFQANITMGGLTSPTLDENSQKAVVNVTAASMKLSFNSVTYVKGIATEESRRLASGVSLFSTTYSVVAVTEVNVPLSSSSFSSPTELYASLTALLTEAVDSGQFTENLAKVSALFNATMLANAQATSVSNGDVEVDTPPASNSGSSDGNDAALNDGAIAGIVIGGFFFLVLVGAAVYYFVFASGTFKVLDSTMVARGEEGTQLMGIVPR